MSSFSLPEIQPVTTILRDKIQHKIDRKTKPLGALGHLEKISLQIAEIQNTLTPKLIDPILLLFAADHGITDEGVSAYPKEVTWQMVQNFLAGGACCNVFAKYNEIQIKVVDAGVDHEWQTNHASLYQTKIRRGTDNFKLKPAMSVKEAETCLQRGMEFLRREEFAKTNVLLFGEMGIGNTSSASMLLSCITGIPLSELVGSGTGLNQEGRNHKVKILSEAQRRGGIPHSGIDIIAEYGGFEIGMMAGAILEAARQKKTILIDGFIATAGFAIAHQLQPNIKDYCIFAHKSEEKGHRLVLEHYQIKPLLDLNMRLGEGTGALAAYPLLEMSVRFLNEMASFEEAGVSDKD
ncbi:nicotinate-nucleotide--dimethylbenzimidazole phosphoribosyltransferase [Leptospira idonii]|uniref:Nicotinate-nucleotide--dimethylbenzimidazole phosphoribosyltransferase n=1 Tax=Leptospira idonii TaxID=1193500 RepID=A0A4V3JY73_9LEPT|nr:nicotinate-nucleotide--dimethylbenzimidazole phosphoribosyltransferase [Leptospira idonii]TGN18896.1 nicotinate-nucleotide--dimethylbenzimidazole phosphoribosyltransferase [Leptospira idonii]